MSPSDDDGSPRSLINGDGSSFAPELAEIESLLRALSNDAREAFRDRNASDVAAHQCRRLLVVAGPGAGKSFLFLARIRHWLDQYPDAEIYVASFVRKLVLDLQADISRKLSGPDRRRVAVTTLHQLARSLVEKNRGTSSQPMQRHIGVIARPWDDVVWNDTLQFEPSLDPTQYSLDALASQFYDRDFLGDEPWVAVRSRYAALCQFYNALGFADMIHLACVAVDEDPALVQHTLWIVDEYQDFNLAEDALVRAVTRAANGVLLAGDDDQALYQELRASHPKIIVSYYGEPGFANAMLPYCGRCDYHICQAASEFMAKHRVTGAIDKVYLPLVVDDSLPRVQVVGTATPSGAVDYIDRFLAAHSSELDEHSRRMQAGLETDPFLMILSPDRSAQYYRLGGADEALHELIAPWANLTVGHSFDYRRVATYYGAAGNARDNFSLRKVLHYENVLFEDVHRLVASALRDGFDLSQVDDPIISEALAKCHEISAVIDAEELDGSAQASALQDRVDISDPDQLARELVEDPIGTGTVASEDELELALPTAGRMSAIELMPMVRSKGLSAQHVIIIGCDDVNMARTTPLTFFVALTRARRSLHLIVSLKARGTTAHNFVGDLPDDHCDYVWYKKTGRTIERFPGMRQLKQKIAAVDRAARRRPAPGLGL